MKLFEGKGERAVGGFFEAEQSLLPDGANTEPLHPAAIELASGRACLAAILDQVKPVRVWVPSYICDAALQPMRARSISLEFYSLNVEMLPADWPALNPEDMLLLVDYFGLLREQIAPHVGRYGKQLILDNTQALYAASFESCWTFTSVRKWFGVPDGAHLLTPSQVHLTPPRRQNQNVSTRHLELRHQGCQKEGYAAFLAHEATISADFLAMSSLSKTILKRAEHELVKSRRCRHFATYHRAFHSLNQYPLGALLENNVPFAYPLLLDRSLDRQILARQGVYIPTFWQDAPCHVNPQALREQRWCGQLLPLPIDHRYTEQDCLRVINAIVQQLNHSSNPL